MGEGMPETAFINKVLSEEPPHSRTQWLWQLPLSHSKAEMLQGHLTACKSENVYFFFFYQKDMLTPDEESL